MGVTYRHTILNVDDDEGGRYAKTKIFERAGYRVIEGRTGADALRLVREERPQLVLLDVGLPDINGIEVCRSIKTNADTARTMVLQVSASCVHPQDRAVGLDGGADVYLSEPVEAAELLGAAKALLRLYDREQESRVLLKELTERERFIKTLVDAAPSTVYLYDLCEREVGRGVGLCSGRAPVGGARYAAAMGASGGSSPGDGSIGLVDPSAG